MTKKRRLSMMMAGAQVTHRDLTLVAEGITAAGSKTMPADIIVGVLEGLARNLKNIHNAIADNDEETATRILESAEEAGIENEESLDDLKKRSLDRDEVVSMIDELLKNSKK